MIQPNATNIKETFDPVPDIPIEAAKKAGTIVAPSVEGLVPRLHRSRTQCPSRIHAR